MWRNKSEFTTPELADDHMTNLGMELAVPIAIGSKSSLVSGTKHIRLVLLWEEPENQMRVWVSGSPIL